MDVVEQSPSGRPSRPVRVAYIMSRFPKLSETFVLFEILSVQRLGLQVELYPLWRERERLVHPEAEPLVGRAHFQPLLSWNIVKANARWLWRKPRAYLGAWGDALRAAAGSFRYLAGVVAVFPKMAYAAERMQADGVQHVHAHFASHPAAAALLIRRLSGIPFSFTAHGSDLHRDRRMLALKVAEADFVVAISRYNRQRILEECRGRFAHKVHVIHCGIDPDQFRPPAARPERPRPAIYCIGAMHEVKGQAYLLEACRILERRGIDVEIHLIGDGPDLSARQRQAARLGIADRVVFHGRQTRGQIVELLAQADLVAAPSVPTADGRREGIPVALMEAMACGIPVVASRLSGIPELVLDGHTGLLVKPRDSLALAGALERLLHDPDLRRHLAGSARDLVVRQFNLHASARRLVGTITSSLGAGGAAAPGVTAEPTLLAEVDQ